MYRNSETERPWLALFLGLLFMVPLCLWNGFVLKMLWNWFVPSIFSTAPHLSMVQAIGLGLLVSVLTYQRIPSNESPLEAVVDNNIDELLVGVLSLVVGFVVQLFV